MNEISPQKQNLIDLRNECLFNSFVMFESVRNIKEENNKSIQKSYIINVLVIILTLTQVFLEIENLKIYFDSSNTFIGLAAFGFSVAIFLFRKDRDTRVDYNIGNNYWLLYKRTQDLIEYSQEKSSEYIANKLELIKLERDVLIRLSPVYKAHVIENAMKQINKGQFLYHSKEEVELIKEHFRRIN